MGNESQVSIGVAESVQSSSPINPSSRRSPHISNLRRLARQLRYVYDTAGDFVQEWTPFLLIVSYFIFSTCMYIICSSGLTKIFWFIFLMTNTYIAGATVVEALESVGPDKEARRAIRKVAEKKWVFPTPDGELLILDLVIVAYLPNEKDIILRRILYALNKIIYPKDKIRINIVYNTPAPIEPLETEMRRLAQKHSQLRIFRVPHSKSKAENINYFCSLDTGSDVIGVFDCDHFTHPYGPRWAVERMIADKKIDTVQGRCVIQNASSTILTALIAVEFDKIYGVSHPGRASMWGFGLFCGSNGYWRAPLLRELKMNPDMMTEDIDSALRAFGKGANVVHVLNVTSYELAPTTLSAFKKQRLRWSQGWAQASIKHINLVFRKPENSDTKRSFKQRFGLLSLLYIRESSYYLVTQYLCLVFGILVTDFPKSGEELFKLLFFQYPVAYWLFIISIICLIATLVITFRVRSDYVRPWMMAVFTILYPFTLLLNAVLGLYGHAREVSKYIHWVPTPRG